MAQLRNLVETSASLTKLPQGYLITSSELADLMDVHASAVTSRGDEWRWRNWIVSRVRREGKFSGNWNGEMRLSTEGEELGSRE